jgi:hypothetical protein
VNPIQEILKGLDAKIAAKKEEIAVIGKVKADIQSAIEFAKGRKMAEEATLKMILTILPPEEPIKPAKGDKGRKRGVTDAQIAKMKQLRKDGHTLAEIAKIMNVRIHTVQRYTRK